MATTARVSAGGFGRSRLLSICLAFFPVYSDGKAPIPGRGRQLLPVPRRALPHSHRAVRCTRPICLPYQLFMDFARWPGACSRWMAFQERVVMRQSDPSALFSLVARPADAKGARAHAHAKSFARDRAEPFDPTL